MIHLKHNLLFDLDLINRGDINFWKIIAKNHTQC